MTFTRRIYIFTGITLAVLVAAWLLPRLPQNPEYHRFADTRAFFGIHSFLNVASNLPFLIAGLWGVWFLMTRKEGASFREVHERAPYCVFFLGFVLTFFGSAYYHRSPVNGTLVWDRLAMAVVCMGILAATLNDRIGFRVGTRALAPLLAFGILSVVYWHWTEMNGAGDLRPYAIVQFYTLAALLLLMLLFPARYSHSAWLFAAWWAYAAAKGFETLDGELLQWTGISGHTFKHLVASLAAVFIIRMLALREPLPTESLEHVHTPSDKSLERE